MLNLVLYDPSKKDMMGEVLTDDNGKPLRFQTSIEVGEYKSSHNITQPTWSFIVEE